MNRNNFTTSALLLVFSVLPPVARAFLWPVPLASDFGLGSVDDGQCLLSLLHFDGSLLKVVVVLLVEVRHAVVAVQELTKVLELCVERFCSVRLVLGLALFILSLASSPAAEAAPLESPRCASPS